jgi:ornithine carbamoyltransferase
MRDFLSIDDLSCEELSGLLDLSISLKADRVVRRDLTGKTIALIFEKHSTRTRVSFEVAVYELGGNPLALSGSEMQLGRGETIEDTARVLERYCHAIVLRTTAQERLERMAAAARIPVVNALSDLSHPCQALADLMTLKERWGSLSGRKLGWVGDGNNVVHSLLLAGAKSAMRLAVSTPVGYEPDPKVVRRAEQIASQTGGSIEIGHDPLVAADGADALATDVWASMGQEAEAETRSTVFHPYRLNDALLAQAQPDALVLHCLPAHRGEEIEASVIDGEHSVVWDEAENRLHTEKALLAWLVGGKEL